MTQRADWMEHCLEVSVPTLRALDLLKDELFRAYSSYNDFHNAHEGYAVIKEELDELWDEVRHKDGQRDQERLLKEAIQVAAMGIRFAVDIVLSRGGSKGESDRLEKAG